MACTPRVTVSPVVLPTPEPTNIAASGGAVAPVPETTPRPEISPQPVMSASPGPSPGPGSMAPLPTHVAAIRFGDNLNRFLNAQGQRTRFHVILLDAGGQPTDVDVPLLWSLDRPQDFSVDAAGNLTALVGFGYSSVVVKVAGTSLEARTVINVNSGSSGGGGGGGGGMTAAAPTIQSLIATPTEVVGAASLVQLVASATHPRGTLSDSSYTWRCLTAGCTQFTPATGPTVFWRAPDMPGSYILELTVTHEGSSVVRAVTVNVLTGAGTVTIN